jgi:hypothetical protein
MLNRYSGKSRGELYKITQDLKNKNQWNPIDAHEIDKAYQETEIGVSSGELGSYRQAREQAFARETPEFQETINDLRFIDLEQEEKGQRMAGEQLDNNLEALITKARGSLQAEADGYVKLGEDGFDNYGEKQALAEQDKRIRLADEERYGGERPYLASKFNSSDSGSITAEQKRNRMLIMEGKLPTATSLPYDSFKGNEIRPEYEGIAGNFDETSEARIQTRVGEQLDPLLDIDDLQEGEIANTLERNGGITEYLSPDGYNKLYKDWKTSVNKENNNWRTDTSPLVFNQFLSEYYGQQALKVAGMRAPVDGLRSNIVIDAGPNHKSSTLRTKRLLEMSNSMLNPEIQNAADFRWIDKDANVVIGDNQSRLIRPGIEPTIPMNIFKASKFKDNDKQEFKGNLIQALNTVKANNTNGTLDDALKLMNTNNQLGKVRRTTDQVKRQGGTRAGKITSSGAFMGSANDGHIGKQYRMDKVLYGLLNASRPNNALGIPVDYQMLDTNDARRALVDDPSIIKDVQIKNGIGKGEIIATLDNLRKAGAIKSLLNKSDLGQMIQPYSL